MKVLYVTGAFPAASETFVARQIEGAHRAGVEPQVLAFARDDITFQSILPHAGGWEPRVHYTRPSGHLNKWRRATTSLAVLGSHPARCWRLLKALRLGLDDARFHYVTYLALAEALLGVSDFDLVHAQFGYLGRILSRLKKAGFFHCPLVVSFRGGDTTRFLRDAPGGYRELYHDADHFCAVSEEFRDLHVEEGCPPGKISIIRSSLDCGAWTYRPRSVAAPVRLLFVGRFVSKKGADVAIAALAHLRSLNIEARLDLVGDGPLRGELEKQAAGLGLTDRVHFAGWKSQAELMPYWDRSDVLVVPSRTAEDGDQEGIPNVIKEAMACGLPVVASRHGGIPELVRNRETGWLFEEGNAGSLAEQVVVLCASPKAVQEVLVRARSLVELEYDTKKVTGQLLDIYRLAVGEGGGGAVQTCRASAPLPRDAERVPYNGKTRPLRVLMWTGSFFPHALGGTFSAFYLAQGLRRQGGEVVFLTDPQQGGIMHEGVYQGFPVKAWRIRSGPRWRRAGEWMRYLFWLWCQRGRVTHFHISGTSPWSLMMARLCRLVCRRPALLKITLDGEDSLDAVDAARHGWLAGRLYRSMDAVVTMTSGQVAKLRQRGYRGLVRTIPNGVDVARFRPMGAAERGAWREKIGIPSQAEVLVYAGYLGERKGTDVLLDLFARLVPRRPGLHLLCVGNYSPTYETPEALREFCRVHGLDPAVVDHPRLHRVGRVDDMEHYLGLADVFVFPSRREGFGTVQIEAMACGLPSVVHRLPGLTEDIHPDATTGVVVDGLDAEAWVAAVEALLDNPVWRERIGHAARARVEEFFSLDAVAVRYGELYREMDKLNRS